MFLEDQPRNCFDESIREKVKEPIQKICVELGSILSDGNDMRIFERFFNMKRYAEATMHYLDGKEITQEDRDIIGELLDSD